MADNKTLEQILQQMTELTETVKDHKPDPATIDMERVMEEFAVLVEGMVERQVAEKLDKQPARRVPGAAVAEGGDVFDPDMLKGNRYARMVRDIARDGHHKIGTQRAKAFDLWLAHKLISKAHQFSQSGLTGGQPVAPPSADLVNALKAMDAGSSGAGAELADEQTAAMLWEDIFLASRIAGVMTTIEMPTNPFNVPLGLGQPTWRKGTANTASTASNLSTAESVLTATELVTEQQWSYTLQEDSVVALMPAIRARLAQSGAEIIDDFALNADATNAATGNINLDDADPADDSYYLSAGQDGVRHQWLVDNTSQTVNAGGDALADGDITDALEAMGKYAVDPTQLVMVPDISTYLKGLLGLTNVVTIDKFGSQATVLTGQLASYRGIPIVVSASHRLAEADGKRSTTAGNNTLGSISIFNKMMWYLGFRRGILVEVDRDIQKRQYIMVTSLREAVAAHGTRSTNTHTAGIRNILV